MARNPQDAERPEQLAIPLPLDLAIEIYAAERVPGSVLEQLAQDINGILMGWQYSSWTSLVEVGGTFTTEAVGQGPTEGRAERTLDARPVTPKAEVPPGGQPGAAERRATLNLNRLGDIRQTIADVAKGLVPSIAEYERRLEQTTDRAIVPLLTEGATIASAEASLERKADATMPEDGAK